MTRPFSLTPPMVNPHAAAPRTRGYSFCESVHAIALSPWHIRRLSDIGRKLGGGIDTDFLCSTTERQELPSGWDLEVVMTPHHLEKSACKRCVAVFREARP